jgi:RND family efflux transporter MFP subunit
MAQVESSPRFEALRIDRSRKTAKRSKARVGVVALAVLLVVLAVVVLATRPDRVTVVEVREARPGETVTALTAAGYVSSERRSTIAPKTAGRLVEVLVKEGQRVNEGDVLARLDDRDAVVALKQAEAQARAASADVGVARAARAKADRDLDQTDRLARTGAVSPTALLDARSAASQASENERAVAARSKAAEDALSEARIRLEDTVVRAPFTGTISKKLADEGAVLAPAAVSEVEVGGIVELVDLDALNVDAELSEDRLASVREGQPALIFLDAYPGKVYEGTASTLRPTIDRAKATAVVKVPFDQPPQGVFPNMGAKVSFLTKKLDQDELAHEPRLMVPRSSIVKIEGRDAVFVVVGNRVRSEPVKIAAEAGNEVALSEGPPAGTPIVTLPRASLRDGKKVRVVAAGEA